MSSVPLAFVPTPWPQVQTNLSTLYTYNINKYIYIHNIIFFRYMLYFIILYVIFYYSISYYIISYYITLHDTIYIYIMCIHLYIYIYTYIYIYIYGEKGQGELAFDEVWQHLMQPLFLGQSLVGSVGLLENTTTTSSLADGGAENHRKMVV